MQRRALVFLILAGVLGLAAMQTRRTLLYVIAYLLGGLVLFSLIWAVSNARWVKLARTTLSLRTQVGRPIEERLSVENRSWLPKLWVEIEDASELPDHHVSRVVHAIEPRGRRTWTVKTPAHFRGRYRLGPVMLRAGDPFGLFVFRRLLPQQQFMTIYPVAHPLRNFAPLAGQQLAEGERRRQSQHVTPTFKGVREYIPGDALNRIHWPSSARLGRLIVKEFEDDPTSDVWIILDMHERTHVEAPELERYRDHVTWRDGPLPELLPITTEYVVAAAASLMRYFLDRNRQVGMIAHTDQREIMQPDRGERPLNRALDYLAVLQATGEHSLRDLLVLESQSFKRGNTLVIISADPFPGWIEIAQSLRVRGLRLIAVLIDPSSFDRNARSQAEVQTQLAMRGIRTYIVRKDDSLSVALSG